MTFREKTGEIAVTARQNYFLIATLFVAAILLLFRNIPVGPIPAGDEFSYSMMSRQIPYSQDWIPNYLYYFVYSSTNYCGIQFYTCVKLINILFLLLTATFVFLTSRLFVGWLVSFLIMIGFLVSPFNVFSSMFMPETMYAAVAWILLYFFVSRGAEWALRDSAAAGLGVAVLALIKPHGIFFGVTLLAAIIFEVGFIERAKLKVVGLHIATFFASFISLKLLLGFLFAGVNGLGIMGNAYTGLAQQHSLIAYLHMLTTAARPVLNHLVAMSLIAGVPLCILLSSAFIIPWEHASAGRLKLFTALFFSVMIFVTSMFTASVAGIASSETLDRLHTRYYDFFIFLFYLIVVVEITRAEQPKPFVRVLAGVPIIILALLSILYLPTHFQQGLVDNPEIHGIFWPMKTFYLFSAVNVVLIAFWIFKSRPAEKLFLLVQVPLGLALSLVLLTRDIESMTHYSTPYTKSGDLARIIWGQPTPEYFVAGPNVGDGWHTHFHLDKMGTRIELGHNAILHRTDIPRGVTAGIIIGNNPTDFPYVVNYDDGSIKIIRLSTP